MAAKKTNTGKGAAKKHAKESPATKGSLTGFAGLKRSLKVHKKSGPPKGTIPANMDIIRRYQFKKGKSGNPTGMLGRQKPIYNAMLGVLKDNPEMLREIAEAAVVNALHDGRFFKEMRDMFDGKPPQSITGPEGGALQVEVTDARKKLLGE